MLDNASVIARQTLVECIIGVSYLLRSIRLASFAEFLTTICTKVALFLRIRMCNDRMCVIESKLT